MIEMLRVLRYDLPHARYPDVCDGSHRFASTIAKSAMGNAMTAWCGSGCDIAT